MTFDPRQAAEEILRKGGKKPNGNGSAQPNGHDQSRVDSFTDVELMGSEVAEPIFIVPGLIPEGPDHSRRSPEDGQNHLCNEYRRCRRPRRRGARLDQMSTKRRRMMLKAEALAPTPDLRFELEWPRLDEDGIEKLDEACAANPKLKLIVIDTWKKISPRRRKDQDDYEHESSAAALLQKLAARHQIAIIIIHHSRKGTGSEDFVDDVLGSTGMTGGADTIIGFRRKRGTSDAEISVAGRDVDECEKALAGDQTTGLWRLLGEAVDHRMSRQRKAILDLLKDGKIRSVKDISEILGERYDATRMNCANMHDDGQLSRIGKAYTVPS